MNIAINGVGRIGKSVLHYLLESKNFKIKLINDLNPDLENLCYLINYDSTYGPGNLKAKKIKKNLLNINNLDIKYSSNKNILDLDLRNIDIAIDCTGIEWQDEKLKKLKKKIKHIIVTNIPKKLEFNYFLSEINLEKLSPKNFIISSGTCDGNAVVPIIKILQKNFQIEYGNITTLHPWLSYQNLVDGPMKSVSDPNNIYSTYVLGRSTINNIIPKTTSVIDVVSKIYPNFKKKMTCLSYRIPTSIVSCAELNIILKKKITSNKIKEAFLKFEKKQKVKLIKNFNYPLTSLDLKDSPYSSNIDHRWINTNSKQVRIVTWYDNERGYASRVIDIVNKIYDINN